MQTRQVRLEVLPSMDYRGHDHALRLDPINQAIAMNQALADRSVADLGHDPPKLRILRNGLRCFHNL